MILLIIIIILTFRGLLELLTALLLPPLPGLEDVAQVGELALALGRHGAVAGVPPIAARRAVLLVDFIV